MKVPLEWVWQNDPEELPDHDHARCIAAPGERLLACGEHPFALTTRPCLHLSDSRDSHIAVSFSMLHVEYRGLDWARGMAQQSWGSDRFDNGSCGGEARQAAGVALLATVERALNPDPVVRRRSAASVHYEAGAPGQPLRPTVRASRRPRPALLPLRVGRACGLPPRER